MVRLTDRPMIFDVYRGRKTKTTTWLEVFNSVDSPENIPIHLQRICTDFF